MSNIKRGVFLVAGLWLAAAQAVAASAAEEGGAGIRRALEPLLPGRDIGPITASPVPGLYEVVIGGRVIYATGDGRYLLQGALLDLAEGKNLTEPRLNAIKAEAVAGVGEENMVIFGSPEAAHTVTVFTDIDCGYCQKLHREMAEYNDAGIRIRYLFYPRAGPNTSSWGKAVSVWCADDRNTAMTEAKLGMALESRSCDNPVDAHYTLGQDMELRGTPSLVLENGRMIGGYVPADRLSLILEQEKEASR